ncbi:MAG: hypothetical protein R2792_19500 [Saprospiraceae bacterium]
MISNGRITAIGDAFTVPQDAKVVEGTGKYIIPGMVDAHIHLFQSGGLYTRPDAMTYGHIGVMKQKLSGSKPTQETC